MAGLPCTNATICPPLHFSLVVLLLPFLFRPLHSLTLPPLQACRFSSSPWISLSFFLFLRHIQSRIGLQTNIHALGFLSVPINCPPLIPSLVSIPHSSLGQRLSSSSQLIPPHPSTHPPLRIFKLRVTSRPFILTILSGTHAQDPFLC